MEFILLNGKILPAAESGFPVAVPAGNPCLTGRQTDPSATSLRTGSLTRGLSLQDMGSPELNPPALWNSPCLNLSLDMWFANGNILFFKEHLQETETLLNDLGHAFPPDFPPPQELDRLFSRLINKNKAFMGGWVSLRISIGQDKTDFAATVIPCPSRSIPFCETGKMALLSPFIKFSGNFMNRYPFSSAHQWAAEQFRISGNRNDTSVFINQRGMITEALKSNLFAIHKNTVFTPDPKTGCVIDMLREKILVSAEFNGFQIIESETMTWASLPEMEEIFTVSEKEGFKWIMGIDTKRFVKTKTELIWRRLNKILDVR